MKGFHEEKPPPPSEPGRARSVVYAKQREKEGD
jgi:hypothetical protein